MKIEFINESKIKAKIDSNDLSTLKINIYELLSNSKVAESLIYSILDIIIKNCNINFSFECISYNLISIGFESFVIFIDVKSTPNYTEKLYYSCNNCYFEGQNHYFSSSSFDEFLDSIRYIKNNNNNKNIKSSFLKNNEKYILKITVNDKNLKKKVENIVRETKLVKIAVEEVKNSKVIIKDDAIAKI